MNKITLTCVRAYAAIAAVLTTVTPANTAEPANGAHCTSLLVDTLRLDCYDTALGYKKETGENSENGSVGAWQIRSEKDDVTGRTNVYATLGYGTSITFRCSDNITSFYINLDGTTAGVYDGATVKYRIDERQASTWMYVSTDNTALGFWNGASAIPFAKSLLGKTELAVRLPTYEGTESKTFDITGIDAAVAQVREACDW